MTVSTGNLFFAFAFAAVAVSVIAVSESAAQNAVCPVLDGNKIAFMGSSVCLGHLASNAGGPYEYYQSFDYNHKGYVFDYATALNGRFKQGLGGDWKVSNISVSGNNTSNVLSRWKKDLLPQCARYVVYGLSLANEGLMSDTTAFDRFKTNVQKLIQDARDSGMVPLLVNNYPNNDYTAAHYAKIKAMDLLIHAWNVPSINVLGALDDGAGHWAPGNFADGGHPNDKGYLEMASAIVPSLFDALKAGKALPGKTATTAVKLRSGDKLGFQPEAGLRSFTLVMDVKARSKGTLLEFKDSVLTGAITLDSAGFPVYRSGKSAATARGKSRADNGEWHTLALTHYAAIGKTYLYLDAVPQAGAMTEALKPSAFTVGGASGPDSLEVRNLLFYRSGMTVTELQAMQSGSLLQSSLELYAPLNGNGLLSQDAMANRAQSRNTLAYTRNPSALFERGFGPSVRDKAAGSARSSARASTHTFTWGMRAFDLAGKNRPHRIRVP